MNIINIACIVIILKVTHYTVGQKSDIFWNAVYNRLGRQSYITRNNWSLHQAVYSRPQFTKRRLDRFRFFHKGLGKRSSDTNSIDTKPITKDKEGSNSLHEMKMLLKKVREFQDKRPYNKQYLVATIPDHLLKNTKNFRMLLGLNFLYNKRTPDSFPENLNPIQAGNQLTEASLDETLDKNINHSVNDLPERKDQYEENSLVEPVITNDTRNKISKGMHSPFDLIFASPDLESYYKEADTFNNTDEKEIENNGEKISKRWWAANVFSKFRSPKYSNRGITTTRYADPALYFIGLGK